MLRPRDMALLLIPLTLLAACGDPASDLETTDSSETPRSLSTERPPTLEMATPSPQPAPATVTITPSITPTASPHPVSGEVINIMYLDNGELMIVMDLSGRYAGDFHAFLDGSEFAWCPRHPDHRGRITCIGVPPGEVAVAVLSVFDLAKGPGPFYEDEIAIPPPPE